MLQHKRLHTITLAFLLLSILLIVLIIDGTDVTDFVIRNLTF